MCFPRTLIRCRQLAVAGTTLATAMLAACGGSGTTSRVRVTIPAGSSVAAAAESLTRVGVILSPRMFRLYASITGRDKNVRPGTYLLTRNQSFPRTLDDLVLGRGLVNVVTIPEGWDASTIIATLTKATGVAPESLEAAMRDTALLHRLTIPTPTLEGYLFPETYVFPDGATGPTIARTMTREFERRWKPEWNERLKTLGMSRHEIMTLASIIEKEAKLADERPVISAVYHNRLHKGMLLQADPTVQYALGKHVSRVLYRDLAVKSKYNTYRSPGLPPGPIASPGAASIEAALFPADVKFLFFVAHPDGHHEFRATLREHEVAKRQMRAEWRAQEQASKKP